MQTSPRGLSAVTEGSSVVLLTYSCWVRQVSHSQGGTSRNMTRSKHATSEGPGCAARSEGGWLRAQPSPAAKSPRVAELGKPAARLGRSRWPAAPGYIQPLLPGRQGPWAPRQMHHTLPKWPWPWAC